jgi:pimeloyl-ACP methyl ester carboxylesterase
VLPDAGHWLHVDNPEGLLAMLDAGFRAGGRATR